MHTSRVISKAQIDKLTFGVSSLDQSQRASVREHLHTLHDHGGGTLYKESFMHALAELRHSGDISEIDHHALVRAFFS